jgi:hypothetical protein
MVLLLLFFISCAFAQAPNCTYLCDDPVCPAICSPKCLSPNCTVSGCPPSQCDPPTCFTQCAPVGNQSISNTCPMCETVSFFAKRLHVVGTVANQQRKNVQSPV